VRRQIPSYGPRRKHITLLDELQGRIGKVESALARKIHEVLAGADQTVVIV
jgi:hypothetical protein